MKSLRDFVILFTIPLLFACSASQYAGGGQSSLTNPALNAVLWQQTSAEYDALCYQAFNTASSSLKEIIERGEFEKSPMVILDLDETVIDNSPYNGKLVLENTEYSKESWKSWVNKREANLVPGALEFIQFAKQNGAKIGYISNRSVDDLEATMALMQRKGIDCGPRDFKLKSESSSKSKRRYQFDEVASIVMLIGDNLADFDDVFDQEGLSVTQRMGHTEALKDKFGKKFIILPNVMYGNWQKALEVEDPAAEKNTKSGPVRFIESY